MPLGRVDHEVEEVPQELLDLLWLLQVAEQVDVIAVDAINDVRPVDELGDLVLGTGKDGNNDPQGVVLIGSELAERIVEGLLGVLVAKPTWPRPAAATPRGVVPEIRNYFGFAEPLSICGGCPDALPTPGPSSFCSV